MAFGFTNCNPYMHSSNLVINDQFSGAYTRPNLVTVECRVPVSELTSGYKAQYAKDSTGWHSWHTGTVAGGIRNAKGIERQVLLSRWIQPVRILSDAEVAAKYKELLDGTDVAVSDNVVSPGLLAALKDAGVQIKESGRIKNNSVDTDSDVQYSRRGSYAKVFFKENVFPPYNEGAHSDAHELAERWARSEDAQTETFKMASYDNSWYLIERFDNLKYGYQIMEKVPAENVERYLRDYGSTTDYKDSLLDLLGEDSPLYRQADESIRRGYNSADALPGRGIQSGSIYELSPGTYGRGGADSEQVADYRSSSQNLQAGDQELKSSRMSPETRQAVNNAIADYKAQTDARNKAFKAVYEAERKQIVQEYKRKMQAMEASYSEEIEDIQRAFFSMVRNHEAKTLEAGAKEQMIEELTEALKQEVAAHDYDKETWDRNKQGSNNYIN